jgi:hypothetical protein
VATGPTVGARRIHVVGPVESDELLVQLDDGDLEAVIVYEGGDDMVVPGLPAGYQAPTATPDELAGR